MPDLDVNAFANDVQHLIDDRCKKKHEIADLEAAIEHACLVINLMGIQMDRLTREAMKQEQEVPADE